MTEPEAPGPTATSDAVAGTEWAIVSIDEQPLVDGDPPVMVAFGHDGRMSGSTGVNQLTASYSLTPDYLTFGPLATTRRAGSPEQMEQEQRVVASFAGMCSYRLTAISLTIDGPHGRVELVTTSPSAIAPSPPFEEPLPDEPSPDDG